ISGRVDYLRGLKENVIMGRLIPAGTGMEYYRNVEVERDETIGESQREEAEEFPEILGGVELPTPGPHPVLAAVTARANKGDADHEHEGERVGIGEITQD